MKSTCCGAKVNRIHSTDDPTSFVLTTLIPSWNQCDKCGHWCGIAQESPAIALDSDVIKQDDATTLAACARVIACFKLKQEQANARIAELEHHCEWQSGELAKMRPFERPHDTNNRIATLADMPELAARLGLGSEKGET